MNCLLCAKMIKFSVKKQKILKKQTGKWKNKTGKSEGILLVRKGGNHSFILSCALKQECYGFMNGIPYLLTESKDFVNHSEHGIFTLGLAYNG